MNMCSNSELPPLPSAIVESLRSIGYSFETAIADIIDNSITANADEIRIECSLDGNHSRLFILDNGLGMNEQTLHEAMRLGGKGPREQRACNDLGRFGLGLKTASFSQCRKVSVLSKTNEGIFQRCWDIDLIKENGWKIGTEVSADLATFLDSYESGTLVVWDKIDFLKDLIESKAEKLFANKMTDLRDHLGLTFHRFLESGKLKITTGGTPVFPWDPFLPFVPEEQKILSPRENIGRNVIIETVVLPHRSYFSDGDYKKAGHVLGWTQMQGFYIYRNDRLLTVAGWMGLRENGRVMKPDRFFDLARIKVDLTNDEDFNWEIDVKKSKASPPAQLVDVLRDIAIKLRKEAYEVYRHRNYVNVVKRNGGNVIPLWETETSTGKLHLSLNQDFPVIRELVSTMNSVQTRKFEKLLKLISETVPADKIAFELGGTDARQMSDPFEGEEFDEMTEELIACYEKSGFTRTLAIEQVKILTNKN